MATDLKQQLQSFLESSLKAPFAAHGESPAILLECPSDKKFGDLSCNIALKASRIFKKPPVLLAEEFRKILSEAISHSVLKDKIEKITVEKPGFINFYLSRFAAYDVLYAVFREQAQFGRSTFGQGQKIQIEFVSANPTGPLSVAHARQAAVGDALANILNFIGFQAVKEFYLNDEGNQINLLGKSIECRAIEIFGGTAELPENGYQGEYIRDIAARLIKEKQIKGREDLAKVLPQEFSRYGVDYLLGVIKKELEDFRVHFDVWSHQSHIATQPQIEDVLRSLKDKGFLFEQEGALWFKTTAFGDDKDRVVKKSDGAYTYFTPDIVYHRDKFQRGFARVFNMWGPDHHGYIPRLKAAVAALGYDPSALEVLIVQLATIYRDGKPVSMSTRRGQYISLREVMDEVGVDAARFFFMMRHINAHLEFDLELAKKQTAENPVYYIQYAHARIHSVIAKAAEANLSPRTSGLNLLVQPEEMDLIKTVGGFSDVLLMCWQQRDPYALVSYLQELATCFHKFYDCHRVVDQENSALSGERLALIDAARIVLANGLRLLGVSTPAKM
ncbi:MAG: arginine--tRNA ligase [Candidatus Omnitrophota bacterium]|nr:arginine--tRNA ligase [Candidatus Omnitrophota bacterium]MDZ4241323.1 arginine--tRNA ligase [Candidatus Omnitrophota bacterium]